VYGPLEGGGQHYSEPFVLLLVRFVLLRQQTRPLALAVGPLACIIDRGHKSVHYATETVVLVQVARTRLCGRLVST